VKPTKTTNSGMTAHRAETTAGLGRNALRPRHPGEPETPLRDTGLKQDIQELLGINPRIV